MGLLLPGIDISYAETRTPNLTPYSVVIVKAYEGGLGEDDRWRQHSAACRLEAKARPTNFTWGGYLFLRSQAAGFPSPEEQVASFIAVLARDGGVPLIAIDWEREEDTPWPRPTLNELRRAVKAVQSTGRLCGLYASTLAPYPFVGQDWIWQADYAVQPGEPWMGWQYAGTGLDRSWWKPAIFTIAGVDPLEAVVARFISASGYNPASLPRVSVPAGTIIRDLAGTQIAKVGPTNLYTSGLVDGHSDQRSVLVQTARYFTDGKARPVWQAATIDPTTPLQQPVAVVSTSPEAIAAAIQALPALA